MPMIYIPTELYDSIIRAGKSPAEFAKDAIGEKLAKESTALMDFVQKRVR